jgi:hypothetical protein
MISLGSSALRSTTLASDVAIRWAAHLRAGIVPEKAGSRHTVTGNRPALAPLPVNMQTYDSGFLSRFWKKMAYEFSGSARDTT